MRRCLGAVERPLHMPGWASGHADLDTTSVRVIGIDPESGKVTFASYYREWSSHQLWESGTRKAMDLAVNSGPTD